VKVSPARKTAFEILLRIEAGRGFASDLLQTSQVSSLGESDRRLATEIVMGVLRWRGDLDFRLGRLSGKAVSSLDPQVATALRMALYQMAYLQKVPDSAAVNEAVELTKRARKRSAAGFVNAVLRKFPVARMRTGKLQTGQSAEAREGACRSVPPWLLERWERNYGAKAASSLAWISTQVPPSVLRAPAHLGDRSEILKKLEESGVRARPGAYAPRALVVEASEQTISKVAQAMGLIIQDEASQLVAELLEVRPNDLALDLCAAPGLKTARLADALKQGLLISCDISARRLATMARLLPRMTENTARVAMVRLDATQALPLGAQFDRILLDAPCSGTGTLGRNPEIKWRLSPQDLERLAGAQALLLRNAIGLLAPGGKLVYATCSLEPEENERVVEAVLPAFARYRLLDRKELSREWPGLNHLFDDKGYLRTRPDLDGTDGFFAVVIVRDNRSQ
jgi:16S rRNA (cytosine967-C5)-methyltransferase